jgi:hypothetical protein
MKNMNEKMFEMAVRTKMRFPFKGMVSVEDLWDLNVRDLDLVFKSLNSQLKQVKEESLLNVRTKQDEEIDLKIEIVKHIVSIKLEEEQLRNKAKENREKKQRILEILSTKQDADLQNKSPEELMKMLNELDN